MKSTKHLIISRMFLTGLLTGSIFCLLCLNTQAATNLSATPLSDTTLPDTIHLKEEAVFSGREVIPMFPGGESELMKYLKENTRYPKSAQKKGIEGKVTVLFAVMEDGSIANIEILKSLHPACDKEAIRVIKAMPKWEPGSIDGKNAIVYYTIPIQFKPEEENIEGITERLPEFPGGKDKLISYLQKNTRYPRSAARDNTQGTVSVGFLVTETGDIEDVKINKGLSPDCDKEAIRVVQAMPRWKFGIENGVPAKVYMSVPIMFKNAPRKDSSQNSPFQNRSNRDPWGR